MKQDINDICKVCGKSYGEHSQIGSHCPSETTMWAKTSFRRTKPAKTTPPPTVEEGKEDESQEFMFMGIWSFAKDYEPREFAKLLMSKYRITRK